MILQNIFNKKIKTYIFILSLFFLIFWSFVIRFAQLGYSSFYGDETKVLYINKTITASQFLLDQRKGPVQYIVAWIVESITNGYSELFLRIPFSVAGFLSVLVFYLLVHCIFLSLQSKDNLKLTLQSSQPSQNTLIPNTALKINLLKITKEFLKKVTSNNKINQISLVATLLFSFSAFNVAFSRVVQYQTFLTLFGFLGLYFFINKKYLISGLFYGLAFLTHYDAVFFTTPLLFFVLKEFFENSFKLSLTKFLNFFLKLVLPAIIIMSTFYVPYFINGYFENNSLNYLSRRVLGGSESQKNYSAFTIYFYNNNYVLIGFLLLPILLFIKNFSKELGFESIYIKKMSKNYSFYTLGSYDDLLKMLFFWFIFTFLILQFFTTNPGTHIHNYLIPLYILSSVVVVAMFYFIKSKFLKTSYVLSILLMLINLIYINSKVFIPYFSGGYPFNVPEYQNVYDRYQLFVYGFPYNRNWNEIREYFLNIDGRVSGIFSNDNDVVATYYLKEFNYTRPGTNFYPQYYIHIKDNLEFSKGVLLNSGVDKNMPVEQFERLYKKIHVIADDVEIFKLRQVY